MTMQWFRWYHGTAYDPKWRVIAVKAQVGMPLVVALWAAILEHASSGSERGVVQNWCHEDEAAALDVPQEQVISVWEAMQGKVLDGNQVTNWPKRQPKREDDTALGRKRQQRHAVSRSVTQKPEVSRNVTTDKIREDKRRKEQTTSSALPPAAPVADPKDAYVREGVAWWKQHVGLTTYPRFGAALKLAVAEHSWEAVFPALQHYVKDQQTAGKPAKVEWFVADLVRWIRPRTAEVDEQGDPTPAQLERWARL